MSYLEQRLSHINSGRPEKPKKKYRIARVAKNRIHEMQAYKAEAEWFRKKNPRCAIKSPECTKFTQGVHHTRGRIGELLRDQRFWVPACNCCNRYVEDHDRWARENGWKGSRLISISSAAVGRKA